MRGRVENASEADVFAAKARKFVRFEEGGPIMPDPVANRTDPDDNNNPKNVPGRCGNGSIKALFVIRSLAWTPSAISSQ